MTGDQFRCQLHCGAGPFEGDVDLRDHMRFHRTAERLEKLVEDDTHARDGAAMVPAATVRRFRRRPVEVQAVQVVGSDDGQAARDIARWCGGSVTGTWDSPVVLVGMPVVEARARVGDWIVREPAAVGHTHRVVWDPTMRADHEEIAP